MKTQFLHEGAQWLSGRVLDMRPRGRAITNVGKTCSLTPCFILAINTFKL